MFCITKVKEISLAFVKKERRKKKRCLMHIILENKMPKYFFLQIVDIIIF